MSLEVFVEKFNERLEPNSIVIFTGAGLSTASGIKDFRGKNGLYKDGQNAEYKLSHEFFSMYPASFYTFFVDNFQMDESIKPNIAHEMIKNLQDDGFIRGVITQNVDNLDILAGTKNVIEAHGNATRFYCSKCHQEYSKDKYFNPPVIPPVCEKTVNGKPCGGIIRPDIVLYGEPLNYGVLANAEEALANAKTILVLGSSLEVAPISSLVGYFINECHINSKKAAFIVNMGKTGVDTKISEDDHVYKYDGDIIEFTKEFNRVRAKKN